MINLPSTYPVACHTDNVTVGSVFVAIEGQKHHGAHYIISALHKGARIIVLEHHVNLEPVVQEKIAQHNALILRVDNARQALAYLSASHAGWPAQDLRIIGITGTKGKTTSTYLLAHVLKSAGYKVAMLSTIKNYILEKELPTHLTTQQPDYLHQFFLACKHARIDYVVMEVAAQAHTLHRIAGITFDAVLFTNFSQEHGEFYSSLEQYFHAKVGIVQQLKVDAPCVVNYDNEWCRQLLPNTQIKTFSLNNKACDVYIQPITTQQETSAHALYNNETSHLRCPALVGMFNVYNVAGVWTLARALNISSENISRAVATFSAVPGRMERLSLPNNITGIIDYAHNPSSFQEVLSTLRNMTDHLIVVFGAGGDRDKSKRPIMGSIAAYYGDAIIVTSDNPRSEDPACIAQEIIGGIADHSKVLCELDRAKALALAYKQARSGSIIALLGKGPDEYQLIGTTKYPFSEKTIMYQVSSQKHF